MQAKARIGKQLTLACSGMSRKVRGETSFRGFVDATTLPANLAEVRLVCSRANCNGNVTTNWTIMLVDLSTTCSPHHIYADGGFPTVPVNSKTGSSRVHLRRHHHHPHHRHSVLIVVVAVAALVAMMTSMLMVSMIMVSNMVVTIMIVNVIVATSSIVLTISLGLALLCLFRGVVSSILIVIIAIIFLVVTMINFS